MAGEIASHVTFAAVFIYNVELIILLLANISCILFLSVLKQTRCFHVNLRLLLANFALTFILLIISRYCIIIPLWIAYFFDADIAGSTFCRSAKSLHDTAVYVSGLGLGVLVIERTVATVFVRSYESKKHSCLGYFLILLQWVMGFLFVYANQIEVYESENDVGAKGLKKGKLPCQCEYTAPAALAISIGTVIVLDMIGIVVFVFLLKYNKIRYRQGNQREDHPQLSERYQTAENVRTTRLLYPMVSTYLVASLIAGCVMICGAIITAHKRKQFEEMGDPNAKLQAPIPPEVFQTFDIVTALYALVFPYLAMYGHSSLLNTMTKIICRHTKVSPHVPLSLDGRQLALPVGHEAEYHFTQLEEMWNRHIPPSSQHRSMIDP